MKFCEHINKLIFKRDKLQVDAIVMKMVTDKVAIDVNVFGGLVEQIWIALPNVIVNMGASHVRSI